MKWPVPQDFNEAVQTPALAFNDPDLKAGQPVVGPTGLPLPRSGNFADVYQIRSGKRDWAVKCFTRPVTGPLRTRVHAELDLPTPPELLARWQRDCARARAADAHQTLVPELRARRERERARRAAKLGDDTQKRREREAEDRRLDEIARAINARLRRHPAARHTQHNDPAAPHQAGAAPPSTSCLSR